MDLTTIIANGFSIIMGIGNIIFYCVLGKDNFRLGVAKTAGLMVLYYILANLYHGDDSYQGLIPVITYCVFTVLALLLYKSRPIMYISVYYCWNAIYNLIGTVLLGVTYAIASASKGSMDWFVRSEASVKMLLVECFIAVLAAILAWLIARKLKPLILDLKGVACAAFVILIPVHMTINSLLKDAFVDSRSYENNPQGLGMVLDTILVFSVIAALLVLAIYTLRQRKAERKKLDSRLQDVSSQYQQESAQIKDEIREWRHDQRNLQTMAEPVEKEETHGQ